MGRHRIVCTEQEGAPDPHDAHIEAVGIGEDPDKADRRLTVDEVYDWMDDGEEFYTKSQSTGDEADVHKYDCDPCGQATLRSDADENADNNLDNLRDCRGWGN